MRDELGGRFVEHPRARAIARDAVVRQTPDAAVPQDLVQLVLFDLLPEVRAFLGPLRALDHAAIHVGDVHRAVRSGRDVGGTEQRIHRPDELGLRVDVPKLRQAVRFHRPQPTDDAGDDLAVEVVADQVFRKSIATIDLIARRRPSRRSSEPSGMRVPGSPAWMSPMPIGAPHTMSRSGSNWSGDAKFP